MTPRSLGDVLPRAWGSFRLPSLSAAGGAPPSGEAADIHRLAQLGRFVRWLLPVTFVFTAIEALTFLLSPQPAIALTAILTGESSLMASQGRAMLAGFHTNMARFGAQRRIR